MPVNKDDGTPASEDQLTTQPETSVALAGISEGFLDGKPHYGLAIAVSSGTGLSTLMIPDITGVSNGQPVFITRPIGLVGKNLKDFFLAKKIALPPEVLSLIEDTTISCEAFYYSTDVVLMIFAIKFDQGLIKSLTGDEALGKLFDVKGASVRVIKSPKASFSVLQKYAASLSGQSA